LYSMIIVVILSITEVLLLLTKKVDILCELFMPVLGNSRGSGTPTGGIFKATAKELEARWQLADEDDDDNDDDGTEVEHHCDGTLFRLRLRSGCGIIERSRSLLRRLVGPLPRKQACHDVSS
jgi:hypothetical protein